MLQNPNFPEDPAGGAYSAPPDPVAGGERVLHPATGLRV